MPLSDVEALLVGSAACWHVEVGHVLFVDVADSLEATAALG